MSNYTRFLDLHIHHPDGQYDFAEVINEQADYQHQRHGLRPKPGWSLRSPRTTLIRHKVVKSLPETGFVATAVSLGGIQSRKVSVDVTRLLNWVCDTKHRGKIRVNCHGDGMGRIGMSDRSSSSPMWISASLLVPWLVANADAVEGSGPKSWASSLPNGVRRWVSEHLPLVVGGKATSGLCTINLALCMGGRQGTQAATLNRWTGVSTGAPGSAVDLVVMGLREVGWHGVEVTASNEILRVEDGMPCRSFGTGGAIAPIGKDWDIDQVGAEIQVTVPAAYRIRPPTSGAVGAIEIPPMYSLNPDRANLSRQPSGGWDVCPVNDFIPPGWIVDPARKLISLPPGWTGGNGQGRRGRGLLRYKIHDHFGSGIYYERITHTAYKIRMVA